jgi:hypothetical protein
MKQVKGTLLIAARSLALVFPTAVAHASHVNDWSVQISEAETFECAFAKTERQRVLKSRAPEILLKEFVADVEELCTKDSLDPGSVEDSGQGLERNVVSLDLLPADWRTQ